MATEVRKIDNWRAMPAAQKRSIPVRTARAAIFGPVGLLAGIFLAKRKTEVTFVVQLSDGRKFLGKTGDKEFGRLRALAFK